MAELPRVRVWAEALLALHLDAGWTFAFDTAKTRAGLCDHARKRISVSRYLAAKFDDDAIHQVLLHEVAHAIAGPRAGHGARWLRIAREIGYEGGRTHDGPVAIERARWVGHCPQGHEHIRFRRPSRPVSCGRCSRRYDPANAIVWESRAA
ncbi:MAG: SprT-like domain-containing protein [Microbacterium sp.]|nr:SprT-like domain-containing protein [Microbacterium sp.]